MLTRGFKRSRQLTCGKAPPLANTPASGSQQATQLSPRAAPPAECLEPQNKMETLNRSTKVSHIKLYIPSVKRPQSRMNIERLNSLSVKKGESRTNMEKMGVCP